MDNYSIYGNSPYGYGGSDFGQYSPRSGGYIYMSSGIALAAATFAIIYAIAAYIFKSVGLYHMAKERGIAHAWFAWVPFLDWYIIGELINQKVVLGTSIVLKSAEFLLPVAVFVAAAVMSSGDYNWAAAVIISLTYILRISAYWRLYKIYRPQSRASFTAWSMILGAGFFIFAIRNDKPFDELEPNKVYEDYYGQKRVLENDYQNAKENIEQKKQENLETLHSEYEQKLDNPDLTTDNRKELREDYIEAKKEVREEASQEIDVARESYNDQVDDLEQEVLEGNNNPEEVVASSESTTNNDVIITPVFEESVIEIEPETEDEIQTDEIFVEEDLKAKNEFDPESIHETIEAINRFNEDTK